MSVTDNGKGHSACIFWAILDIVIGIAIIVICNKLAEHYGVTTVSILGVSSSSQNDLFNYFKYLGYISGGVYFLLALLMPIAISKTGITVYNDRVEGVGVSKYFLWGDVRTFSFLYPLNQVSIELNGGKLVVHGQNTYYCVYVKNGSTIQNALWDAKKRNNTFGGETTHSSYQ